MSKSVVLPLIKIARCCGAIGDLNSKLVGGSYL